MPVETTETRTVSTLRGVNCSDVSALRAARTAEVAWSDQDPGQDRSISFAEGGVPLTLEGSSAEPGARPSVLREWLGSPAGGFASTSRKGLSGELSGNLVAYLLVPRGTGTTSII